MAVAVGGDARNENRERSTERERPFFPKFLQSGVPRRRAKRAEETPEL